MLKRIWLFILTNLAVILLLTVIFFVLENIFWIKLTGNTYYLVFAAVIWFWGAFISLLLSKWTVKQFYDLTFITQENLEQLDAKERVVWDTVVQLSERYNIKTPEVGIYVDSDPNAFATWPSKNNSLVAVSTGLLEHMDIKAIEWVIAHEMAHILNGDMVTMTLVQWVINTFVIFLARIVANIISNFFDEEMGFLAHMIVVMILEMIFWIIASIVVMAFSRHREFKADEWSAFYVGKEKMIAGLEALKRLQDLAQDDKERFATMKISTKSKSWFMMLFSSHPDLETRIENLRSKSF